MNKDDVEYAAEKQNGLKLKIDAHIVKQLGDELIADSEQAILELVKNSYDADSPWCTVEIDTTQEWGLDSFFNKDITQKTEETLVGKVKIIDRGCGMTLEQLDKGWLTISHSEKRELKKNKRITQNFNRAYQGDKGLGRLSSMKLGRILRISTSVDGVKGICITLDWKKFESGRTLDEVPLYVEEIEGVAQGTSIEIFGLNNLQHWQGELAGGRIQSRLSSLLDPFGMDKTFKVTLKIDSKPFPLTEFTKNLLTPTVAQFNFEYNGNFLVCKGRVRLPYYMPSDDTNRYDTKANIRYSRYLLSDNGEGFFNKLLEKGGRLKSYDLKLSEESDWFIEFEERVPWEEIPKDSVHSFLNPNPFKAQWNYFFKKGAIYDAIAKGKLRTDELKALEDLVGVGVYKNDFRVGTSKNDWLGFSTDKTSGRGFYSIRPENIIGYIKFDGYDGETLKEKSDRQGFVENEEYYGFWVVTRAMMAFANDFLNITRREVLDYVKDKLEKENNKPKNYTGQAAAAEIEHLVERTESVQKHTRKSETEAKAALNDAKKSIDSALSDLFLDTKARAEIQNLRDKVQIVEAKFNSFKVNYSDLEDSILSHKYSAEKIIDALNDSKSKMEEFYESAAVGLSAENLAHDINPLLDEITLNTSYIKSKLTSLPQKDKTVFLKLNQISSTTRVIAKDISLINPMLRSRRNSISEFTLQESINEYIELRKEKFESKGIRVVTNYENQLPIKFVRGKFTQILDNLFRNSEYWLEHIGKHTNVEKEICIEIAENGFFFWDSGPGIYEKMEDVLFDMFETGKSNGQGLGLFIVSTILRQVDCSIELLDERNTFSRKYKFFIDLSCVSLKG